jgi:hypothetical protein
MPTPQHIASSASTGGVMPKGPTKGDPVFPAAAVQVGARWLSNVLSFRSLSQHPDRVCALPNARPGEGGLGTRLWHRRSNLS